MEKIDRFSGEHAFLSNFCPAKVVWNNIEFATVEHAYQAAKSKFPEDWELVRKCETPGEAKRTGRKIRIREDWESMKVEVMLDLVSQKFENQHLKEKLLATGNAELIEGNWWNDTFWGVCNGQGQNILGVILSFVRMQIQKEMEI